MASIPPIPTDPRALTEEVHLIMRGQKRVEDARKRGYHPRIHLVRKKFLGRWMDCRFSRQ
jgi:hypothetical protein